MIKSVLNNKANAVFLSSAELMQTRFADWTKNNIADITFLSEDLDLKSIIPSLWNKVHSKVANLLHNDVDAIADEKLAQARAERSAQQLLVDGYNGKVFTLRQAMVLLDTAKLIGM